MRAAAQGSGRHHERPAPFDRVREISLTRPGQSRRRPDRNLPPGASSLLDSRQALAAKTELRFHSPTDRLISQGSGVSRQVDLKPGLWPLIFTPVSRGGFGFFVRVFPRVFGVPGGTCTKRPKRGGTAAALTIGPAATSLFRRASTCRFRPSRARAPSSGRSPVSAKTIPSTVSDLFTVSTA